MQPQNQNESQRNVKTQPAAQGDSRHSRRDFLAQSAAVAVGAAAASFAIPRMVHAAENNQLKVGLIGCGGRGGGAALNALNADSNSKLHALGDAFQDQIDKAVQTFKTSPHAARAEVPKDRQFIGLDSYKGVIDSCDVVLLATPPHFRPMHLEAALNAGKHVFCEKPVAVDATGVRKVMELAKVAQEKRLNLVSGLCYRYDDPKVELMKRVHEGQLGDLITLQVNFNTGPLWSSPRKPEWSDMEWQMRNWLYFYWLSGDHIVEQHVHSLDKALWAMQDVPPDKATASGGRINRVEPQFGNIYDHFNTVFEWKNGVKCFASCRQWSEKPEKVATDVSDWVYGTKGRTNVMDQFHRITDLRGKALWRKPQATINMYDAEHMAMFNAIRKGEVINNGDYMCKSTLMGIMGREAAYTGKTITWDQITASQQKLGPENYAWGAMKVDPIPVPGTTRFV
jgi:myo-inositol 2-dehydrogenase/D-chiro-inositol 1-dehydrogenase